MSFAHNFILYSDIETTVATGYAVTTPAVNVVL